MVSQMGNTGNLSQFFRPLNQSREGGWGHPMRFCHVTKFLAGQNICDRREIAMKMGLLFLRI